MNSSDQIRKALKTWPKDKAFGVALEGAEAGEEAVIKLTPEFIKHMLGVSKADQGHERMNCPECGKEMLALPRVVIGAIEKRWHCEPCETERIDYKTKKADATIALVFYEGAWFTSASFNHSQGSCDGAGSFPVRDREKYQHKDAAILDGLDWIIREQKRIDPKGGEVTKAQMIEVRKMIKWAEVLMEPLIALDENIVCEACGLVVTAIPEFKEGECPGEPQHTFRKGAKE